MIIKCSGNYGNRYSAFLHLTRGKEEPERALKPPQHPELTHHFPAPASPELFQEKLLLLGWKQRSKFFKSTFIALLLAGQIIPNVTASAWKESITLDGNKTES